MNAGILPTSNNYAVAFGPGNGAHQTFQVDNAGNINGLHATVQDGPKKKNLY
jgi:hypothetical protein